MAECMKEGLVVMHEYRVKIHGNVLFVSKILMFDGEQVGICKATIINGCIPYSLQRRNPTLCIRIQQRCVIRSDEQLNTTLNSLLTTYIAAIPVSLLYGVIKSSITCARAPRSSRNIYYCCASPVKKKANVDAKENLQEHRNSNIQHAEMDSIRQLHASHSPLRLHHITLGHSSRDHP